jgi:hypothetical protein
VRSYNKHSFPSAGLNRPGESGDFAGHAGAVLRTIECGECGGAGDQLAEAVGPEPGRVDQVSIRRHGCRTHVPNIYEDFSSFI